MSKRSDGDYFAFIANQPKPKTPRPSGAAPAPAPRPFKPADTGKFVREAKIQVSSASDSILVRCLKYLGVDRHDTPPNDPS
jgi:hypothetical protein